MCTWTRPPKPQRSNIWPLQSSTSVWISPFERVFMVHTLHPSVCPLWTLQALSSNLQGQDRNFLSSSRGKNQPWWWESLHISLPPPPPSYLWLSLPHPFALCPILSSLRGWEQTEYSPTAGGFQWGGPSLHLCIKGQITLSDVIFLRAMAVGVSGMTASAPVGDVWSGMERQGLTEVLGSYRTECDLNSQWIPREK